MYKIFKNSDYGTSAATISHSDDASRQPNACCKRSLTQNIVKNAICVVLAVLMFALAFLPVVSNSDVNNYFYYMEIEDFTTVDYVSIMFATSKHYDTENDAVKIEEIKKEIEAIYDELKDITCEYNADDYIPIGKTQNIYKRYTLERLKLDYSIDGKVSTSDMATMICMGILSLLYIVFTGAIVIISMIALVLSLAKALARGSAKVDDFKFVNYHYLMIVPLFIALAMLLCVSSLFVNFEIEVTFVFSLLFDCLAVAFVFADVLLNQKSKAEFKKALIKIGVVCLTIISVGCCFAPCIQTTREHYYRSTSIDDIDGSYSQTSSKKTIYYSKADATIFTSLDVPENEYDDYYQDRTHEQYMNELINYYGAPVTVVAEVVFLDVKTPNYTSAMSSGFIAMLLAIVVLGAFDCALLFDNKESKIVARVLGGLAIALMIVAFAFNITILVTINKHIAKYSIDDNIMVKLDAGLICSTIFALASFAIGIVVGIIRHQKIEELQTELFATKQSISQ